VQACALNPRMVMNSWKADHASNLPWMHPEVAQDVTAAIVLRYRLMPYLWACVQAASQSHVPIIAPTFFHFPHDELCYEDCDDFMLGPDLLVAPVVEDGARQRTVYLPRLPQGQQWFDFYDRTAYECGTSHRVPAALSHLPLFARQGARIQTAAPLPGQVARHDDPLAELLLF
jgi:alpha-glucosidase